MEHDWKDIVVRHLGKKMKNKEKEIKINIVVVDIGIKPAYLLDFVVSVDTFTNFLQELKSHNLMQNNLLVVKADMDILIANYLTLRCISDKFNSYFKFVDVTYSLAAPVNKSRDKYIEGVFDTLSLLLDNKGKSSVELPCNMTNMSTVFGVCVGYPVVYWYDMDTDGNCLSMQSLSHHEVIGKCHVTDDEHVIYSFSVPSTMEDLTEHAKKWFDDLYSKGRWKESFAELLMKTKIVVLPSVNL